MGTTAVTIDHDYYEPINALVGKTREVESGKTTYFGRISHLYSMPDAEKRVEGMN